MKNLFAILLLIPTLAFAWSPTKPVECLIGHTPGTVNESVFRMLAVEVEKNTKAKFIIINKPGVGGAIASSETSKKPADGYHINMVSIPGTVAVDKIALPTKDYEVSSFEYVFDAAQSPFAIVANANNSVSTPAEWVKDVKNNKVSITANGGARLAYEEIAVKLNLREDINGIVRINHKGPVDAVIDVVNGNVTYAFVPVTVANTFYKGNKIKIIAVTSVKPMPQWPNIPTMNTVVPNYSVLANWGLVLPKGAPAEVVEWYSREFNKALKSPAVIDYYNENLLQLVPYTTPKSFENYVKNLEIQLQPIVDTVLLK